MAYSKQNFQDGQILNAANLEAIEDGIIAAQGAHNLLDNSDFTNPVNQRGATSYTKAGYTIDRWELSANTLNVGSDDITLVAGDSSPAVLTQYISGLRDGTYTQALNVNGTIYTRIIQLKGSTITTIDNSNAAYTGGYVSCVVSSSKGFSFNFVVEEGYSITVRWAALYKGSYTAGTLPPYVPKGKHVEMLNCNVPLAPHNLLDNSDFRDPVNHQGASEYSGYFSYTIDRWFIPTSHVSVTVQSGSIKATATSGNTQASISQNIASATRYAGKTLTLAVYVKSNVTPRIIAYNGGTSIASKEGTSGSYQLLICNFTVPADITDGALSIRIQSKSTQAGDYVEAQWAALYDGSYTADTLPVYVPKGKHVEMVNCGVPLQPHNLLDNSNFRNPVNQLGWSDKYEGVSNFTTFVIDRWKTWSTECTYTLSRNGLRINNLNASSPAGPQEELPNPKQMTGKTYTLAVGYSDGNVACGNVAVPTGTLTEDKYLSAVSASGTRPGMRFFIKSDYSLIEFQILISAGQAVTVEWAALYEGSYTADTLPAYIPKGKHVEMLNCGVPLAPHNLLDNSDFTNPVNQRGKTSYTGAVYTIDRWKLGANTLNVGSDGITLVAGNNSSAQLTQYISGLRDGVYTQALNVNGTIYTRIIQLSGSTITTIDGSNATYTGGDINCLISNSGIYSFHFRVLKGHSITVRWAALYEGSYDASTLPAYQPKGYAAELAECQRYYWPLSISRRTGYCTSSSFMMDITSPVPMRVTPTVNLVTAGSVYCNGVGPIAVTGATVDRNGNVLNLTASFESTTGISTYAGTLINTKLEFNADL